LTKYLAINNKTSLITLVFVVAIFISMTSSYFFSSILFGNGSSGFDDSRFDFIVFESSSYPKKLVIFNKEIINEDDDTIENDYFME